MGTIMMTACKQLGIAGVVMDGAVRDSLEIDEMDFPVFSVGTNPNGPTKNVPGRIGHPISVGGVMVHPGDFVIGDGDGVVVVEREKIAACCRSPPRRSRTRPRASPPSRAATPPPGGSTPRCARPACSRKGRRCERASSSPAPTWRRRRSNC